MNKSNLGSNNYIGTSFQEDLNQSDKLVKYTAEALKSKYPENKYEIIESFDNHELGVITDLTESETEEMISILSKRFKNNPKEESLKYIHKLQEGLQDNQPIKHGMRSFYIAGKDKTTNKRVELIECKDFPQLVYFDKTGLPKFYLQKLNLLKKIIERQQGGDKIKQSISFIDTPTFLSNLKKEHNKTTSSGLKQKISNKKAVTDKNNQLTPYLFELTEEVCNRNISTNSSGKPISSYFINRNWNAHPEANHQILWEIKDAIKIEDYYGYTKDYLVDNTILNEIFSTLEPTQVSFLNKTINSFKKEGDSPLINLAKTLVVIFNKKDTQTNLKEFLINLGPKKDGINIWNNELLKAGIDTNKGTIRNVTLQNYKTINNNPVKNYTNDNSSGTNQNGYKSPK